jgi:methionyl-tRNA formyltransferase
MRVVFMGTPTFAVPTLQALIDSPIHHVVAVYSQPPRPSGRGLQMNTSPVHKLAEAHDIPVFTPTSLKPPEVQAKFRAHLPHVAVVAAYGMLLPGTILKIPTLGCINVHPSDLPRWRGAAPIQRTIMSNDTHTACCIMQMDAGLDTGAVLARRPFLIPPEMDAAELHDNMANYGAKLVLDVLKNAETGHLIATPQEAEGVTYAAKITKADRIIDWSQPAEHLHHLVRGLAPSGAITVLKGENIKIFKTRVERGDADKPAGIVLDDALLINAGHGSALRLLELQRPNKNRQPAAQFLQSQPITAGAFTHNPVI